MNKIIDLIKILRAKTNAGVGICKEALEKNGLDLEKATVWLREQGIIKSAKMSDHIASEGLTNVVIDKDFAVILEINCETDFVAKNDSFIKLVNHAGKCIIENKPCNEEKANDFLSPMFAEVSLSVGEKIVLKRFEIFNKKANEYFGHYVHTNGKIAVLLIIDKNDQEFADNLALHIAANNSIYISAKDIPPDVLAREKKIVLENMKKMDNLSDKPQSVIDKIIDGKINKNLNEFVLEEQMFLLEDNKKISQVLKEKEISVVKFIRYQIGE